MYNIHHCRGTNYVLQGGFRRGGIKPAFVPRMPVITENVSCIIGKNRRCKCDNCSTAKGYIEKKSCPNEEKENTGLRCTEPQQQILQAAAAAATAV